MIEAMGLTLEFDDGGWLDVRSAFYDAEKLAGVRIGVLAAAALVAAGFSVYLFVSRRKKEYAIMRALGTSKSKSASAIALPFTGLAAVSVVLGGAAGYIYIAATLSKSRTISFMREATLDLSIPFWVFPFQTSG